MTEKQGQPLFCDQGCGARVQSNFIWLELEPKNLDGGAGA